MKQDEGERGAIKQHDLKKWKINNSMKLSNSQKRIAFEFQKIIVSRAINALCGYTGKSREEVFEWLIDGEKWDGVKVKV